MAAAGLAGFLGLGQPHEDPQLKAMRQNQLGIQNNLLQYARSAPGSAPDELANLSEARGQLGAQQRTGNQAAMAAWNPNQGLPRGQFVQNQQNANIAQAMALQSGMLQNASANRRQALLSAANVGSSAADMYRPQQSQFPQVMGQLAQQLAYQQARNKGGATTATPAPPGDVPTSGPGPVNGPMLPPDMSGAPTSFGDQPAGDASAQIQALTGGGMPPGLAQMLQMFAQQMAGQPGMTPMGGAGAPPPIAPGGGMDMSMLGGMGQGAAQGLQGSMSPGNEPFGNLTTQNQIRQSNMIPGIPTAPPGMMNAGQVNDLLRLVMTGRGTRMPF
jgi:hypothetical protein